LNFSLVFIDLTSAARPHSSLTSPSRRVTASMYDQQADPGARAGGGPADAGHGVEVLAVVGGEDDEAVLGLNALEAVGHGKTVRSEFTLMVDR
jgi:hypothetical protein